MNTTYNTIPKRSDYIVVIKTEGVLRIISGKNLNDDHKNYGIVDECNIINGELMLKMRRKIKMTVDKKVTENEGYIEWNGTRKLYHDILNMAKYPDMIVEKYYKRSLWRRMLGKPGIQFSYITLEDDTLWNQAGCTITLKEEYWKQDEYQSNVYILEHLG